VAGQQHWEIAFCVLCADCILSLTATGSSHKVAYAHLSTVKEVGRYINNKARKGGVWKWRGKVEVQERQQLAGWILGPVYLAALLL